MITDKVRNNENLGVNDEIFEQVNNFRYLDSMLNQTSKIRKKFKKRINEGNTCFYILDQGTSGVVKAAKN